MHFLVFSFGAHRKTYCGQWLVETWGSVIVLMGVVTIGRHLQHGSMHQAFCNILFGIHVTLSLVLWAIISGFIPLEFPFFIRAHPFGSSNVFVAWDIIMMHIPEFYECMHIYMNLYFIIIECIFDAHVQLTRKLL